MSTALRPRRLGLPVEKHQDGLRRPMLRALGLAGVARCKGAVRIASAVSGHVVRLVRDASPRSALLTASGSFA